MNEKKKTRSRTTKQNRARLLIAFGLVCVCFLGLAVRMGYHQIYKADEYAQKAVRQQTSDRVVTAIRGSIVDINGSELAKSATTHTIWIRPDSVKGNGNNEAEKIVNSQNEATVLAEILGMSYDEVYGIITSEKKLLKLAKNVDKDVAEEIREVINEKDSKIVGVEIVEDAKRYYPLGAFASQILGTTTDDNSGLTGLERYYNSYLAGLNGRWITTKDTRANSLAYGTNKYYSAEDGLTLRLTVDENIQYIVEQKIAEGLETTKAKRVMCIVMDPKTGAILATAQTNEYDPNNPRDPAPGDEEAFGKMTEAEKVDYWNQNWRSFCINDVYEPGSTFKLITTSIALDEGVTYVQDKFFCPGHIKVADRDLHCWNYPAAHGTENLPQAVQNSCNVAMVQLVQRIGLTRYFDGLDRFGITEKTGIDYPGEGGNIIQTRSGAGPVGLATMSYGQGIAVTPISMITAVSSIANGGKLMQPHFMDALLDSDGNVVEQYEPEIRNITISAQTAADMLEIMESVVSEGGGGTAKIAGYRIGGKTGTASKPIPGGYSKTDIFGSMLVVAPLEDPQFVCLVIVDTPRVGKYGSTTAGPICKNIMQDIFVYKDIKPNYTEADLKAKNRSYVTIPDVTGKSIENAIGILAGRELNSVVSPELENYEELTVVDQYPKAGETAPKNSTVTLYYE